jgi:hypothetical protein
MSLPDPKDLPLQGTELQTDQTEPVPVLQSADMPGSVPVATPDVRRHSAEPMSPLAKRLQVLLRCHEAAGWARVGRWIWWGVRALIVLVVSIALAIGVGRAAFHVTYDPDSHHLHEEFGAKDKFDEKGEGRVYFVRGKPVSRAVYEEARESEWRAHNQSDIYAIAAGVATLFALLLAWTLFEWFWKRRDAALEEQIAAIQRDHASEVTAWGGPAVLREPAAVAEILRLEMRA